jgi:hypothetical protein
MPRKTIAILAGAGAAVAAAVFATFKRRGAAGASSEPAGGGPDAEAASQIAREPTSPADVPAPPDPVAAEPGTSSPGGPASAVNAAMEEIAGEPTSPADVPGAEPPTEVRPPAADRPAGPTGTDAPSNPAVEPGNHAADAEPHHALNTPVGDPDPTEWPDPYEKREDPRDPVDPDGQPFGQEPHPQTGSESTSEPPPSQGPEAGERARPPQRDNLDD